MQLIELIASIVLSFPFLFFINYFEYSLSMRYSFI